DHADGADRQGQRPRPHTNRRDRDRTSLDRCLETPVRLCPARAHPLSGSGWVSHFFPSKEERRLLLMAQRRPPPTAKRSKPIFLPRRPWRTSVQVLVWASRRKRTLPAAA